MSNNYKYILAPGGINKFKKIKFKKIKVFSQKSATSTISGKPRSQ